MSEDSQVTAAEIARAVGVGRAAVSNWRRRYLDFPKPVGGTPTSPTFSWAEVQSWLRASGRLSRPVERQPGPEDDTASPKPPDGDRLPTVTASLVPELDAGLVLDPACGAGRLITEVAGSAKAGVLFAAQDADSASVEMARDGFENISRTPLVLGQGDPFTKDKLAEVRMRADVVLCAPPIGSLGPASLIQLEELTLDPRWEFGLPASTDPAGIWTQICYSYLKPGGIAIVLLPASSAVKPAGRRIRAELIRRGALHTVIGVPQHLGPNVIGGLHIWMLRRPDGPPDHRVRMVDLSEADDLPESRAEWAAVFKAPARTKVVAAIDLLDDEVALVPADHVRLPLSNIARRYQEAHDRLKPLLNRVIAETPVLRSAERRTELPLTSLAEMQRAGALKVLGRDPGLRLGDVVVPPHSDPLVVSGPGELEEVKRRGGIVEIIRCDPDQLDPFFVAGFLRHTSNHRETATGTGSSARAAVRKARIPRIPLSEQRRYGAAFQRISDWTRLLQQASRLGQDAAGWAVHGLATGVLDPDEFPEG